MTKLLSCIVIVGIAFAGCKKKSEDAAPAGTTEAKPAETKPAEPKPAEAAKSALAPSGIAECDAVIETYKKFQACTKIKDEDRAVQEVNIGGLNEIITASKTASDKEMGKTAAVANCKDQDAKLKALITTAGC
ncbi:MAG: hypothetical protein JWO36_7341 [Myxococcales bacterium]|nr:hypothetical protein [Myxococcales bacterium]